VDFKFYCLLLVSLFSILLTGCSSVADRQPVYERPALHEMPKRAITSTEYERAELPPLDKDSTLADYLKYAALNNAGLRTTFEKWKAALLQVAQAKALPDPQFTYSYFIEEVETRVGPQEHRFAIMQKFPWLGKIEARTDAAAAAARAARKRYEAEKLKVFRQVKDAYAEYAYLARATDIARQNLQLIEHFEQVARAKYRAAIATHPDVIRAQLELAKLQDIVESLEELNKPIAARLNAALNRSVDAPLAAPTRLEPSRAKIGHEQIAAMLKSQNPELAALNFDIESAERKVDLAKKRFWPDVGAGISWIETGSAFAPGVRDSGKDPVMLTFSMNLPLWHDSYAAARHQAEALVRMQTHRRKETENSLLTRAEEVLYEYQDSGRKVGLYGNTLVPKSEELLRAAETAYQAAAVDFLSLIDAQRTLLKYQLEYEKSVRDTIQKLAELEMLAGGELSEAKRER